MTCYEELEISLGYVFQNIGLPVVEEMYDEFFLDHKLIMGQKLPTPLGSYPYLGASIRWDVSS